MQTSCRNCWIGKSNAYLFDILITKIIVSIPGRNLLLVLSRPDHPNCHGLFFRPLLGSVCFYVIFSKKNKKIDPLFNLATSLENFLGI